MGPDFQISSSHRLWIGEAVGLRAWKAQDSAEAAAASHDTPAVEQSTPTLINICIASGALSVAIVITVLQKRYGFGFGCYPQHVYQIIAFEQKVYFSLSSILISHQAYPQVK